MTINNLWRSYKQNSLEFLKEKPLGRKADEIPATIRKAIIDKRNLGYGIRKIEGLLSLEGINISHNKIHHILRDEGLVKPEPKKALRKNTFDGKESTAIACGRQIFVGRKDYNVRL